MHSAETVNDGRFHTVELVTFNRMVNLSVDGGEPTTLDSQGRSQPGARDAPLYVGGTIRVAARIRSFCSCSRRSHLEKHVTYD